MLLVWLEGIGDTMRILHTREFTGRTPGALVVDGG